MKFFSFWRSLASFRVRIALNLKNLPAEVVFIDLDANAHRADEYRSINPQMALPLLVEDDGTVLFQSLAILEYLEETHPTPPLLPSDPRGRARVRGLAQMIASEGHLAGHKDTGTFCHGDTPTFADICMVGHVTAAINQQVDLAIYPTVKRIHETAMALPEFAKAHPSVQPDTPEAMRPKGT